MMNSTDVLAWLCAKADEENKAHARGARENDLPYRKRRAAELPKLIQQLREMRFDLTEEADA